MYRKLKVIQAEKPVKMKVSLQQMIDEKRLLKLKWKLWQIYLLDSDLELLDQNQLSLSKLDLKDIYITDKELLYSPTQARIIKKENNALKLKSYFLYFSYLYNIDFVSLYHKNQPLFWEIFNLIQIPEEIKNNFTHLLDDKDAKHFGFYLSSLDNADIITTRILIRKKMKENSH